MSLLEKYQRDDAAYGVISSRCRKGAFVHLDNGELAFAYNAGCVPKDAKVICSVIRPATQERCCTVKLESVCGCFEAA